MIADDRAAGPQRIKNQRVVLRPGDRDANDAPAFCVWKRIIAPNERRFETVLAGTTFANHDYSVKFLPLRLVHVHDLDARRGIDSVEQS